MRTTSAADGDLIPFFIQGTGPAELFSGDSMHTDLKQFSVVIPTHNCDHLIGKTIDSLLGQTRPPYEIIVIDDSSTDKTPEILASYGQQIKTKRLEAHDPGMSRNTGITMSTGEYVVFLDHDDMLLPWALATYAAFLNHLENPPVLLAKAQGIHSQDALPAVEHPGTPCNYYRYDNYVSKKHTVWLSASHLVIKRDCLIEPFCFHNELFPFDDLDFILSGGEVGPVIHILSPLTVLHRVHEDNLVKDIPRGLQKLEAILTRERKGSYPGGLRRKPARLAIIGGHVCHWSRRALSSMYYKKAFRMLLVGRYAVGAALINKCMMKLYYGSGKKQCSFETDGPLQEQ